MLCMALTRQQMLTGMYARDRAHNGRYLVGVTTTGIYCLPDCPARKPKAGNVLFFLAEADARRAGLRACKRCRPDHFYSGVDGDAEVVLALANQIRATPERFGGAYEIVRKAGFGATKLQTLFLHQFHETPHQFLIRARIDRALALLTTTSESPADIGFAVGFGSVGSFYEHFKARLFLPPQSYRALGQRPTFELQLPVGYSASGPRALLGRDPASPAERACNGGLCKALWLDGVAARLDLEFKTGRARCTLFAAKTLSPAAVRAAHERTLKLLGLHWDPRSFLRASRRLPQIKRLTKAGPELRPAAFGDPFETLCWAVVGQQVTVQFAAALRRRVIRRAGTEVPGGLLAHPQPAQLADLDPTELAAMKMSRAKARTLLESAAHIAAGDLDLDALPARGAPELRRRVSSLWGVGPWSTEYLLLRGYGYADVAPVGDSGLRQGLKRFFNLDKPPGDATAAGLMRQFAPHRSLATHHLWRHWMR